MTSNKHVTQLNINASALEQNLNFFKSRIPSSTKILVVVKAFGYGSDALKVASFLKDKVDYFAVAYAEEGIALREGGIETPILVLHPQIPSMEEIAKYHLEPSIYSEDLLDAILDYCTSHCISEFPCHLKFNTGLNRLGFAPSETQIIVNFEPLLYLSKIVFATLLISYGISGTKITSADPAIPPSLPQG